MEQLRTLYAPWINGKPPKSYEYAMQECKNFYDGWSSDITHEKIVQGGGACIGGLETCLKVITDLAEAGVDEVLLHMQVHGTPHDKVMQSIRLFSEKIMPKFR
jgi:hypothetical protein